MTPSLTAFKRARPALGTTVEIQIHSGIEAMSDLNPVFERIQEQEALFNFHDENSLLSIFNRTQETPDCPLFRELWSEARHLKELSEKAFFPYSPDGRLDLSGIAKGFIVDQAVLRLHELFPEAQGCINAGGDLSFFKTTMPIAHLRLGSLEQPIFRELQLKRSCLATSSLVAATEDPASSTRYHQALREGLSSRASVVVQADRAVVADGLTKVALFGSPEILAKCCDFFKALAFTFNAEGDLVESFGAL